MQLVGFIIRIYHDARSPERQIGIVNWRQVAQDRDGWSEQMGRRLSVLDIGATEDYYYYHHLLYAGHLYLYS